MPKPCVKEDRLLKQVFPVASKSCEQCNRPFGSKKDLRRHLLTHTETRLFACQQCTAQFRREQQLREHQLLGHKNKYHRVSVSGVWSFQCATKGCGAEFKSETEMRKHVADKHLMFACQVCAKEFGSRAGRKFHTDTRHKSVKYACTLCSKSYTQRSSLQFHSRKKHNVL